MKYNLELDGLSVNLDGADLEVDTDGGHEVVCENIVLESDHLISSLQRISAREMTFRHLSFQSGAP